MDCAIVPLKRYPDLNLIETVDFFYPLVDNPFLMGKIAFANVVSDLCSIGVTKIDHVNILISSPTEFTEEERDIILPLLLKGIAEHANSIKVKFSLIKVSLNPWCIIGGIASTVCKVDEIVPPVGAKAGNVLILTKPIGTQLATSVFNWMDKKANQYEALKSEWNSEDSLEEAIKKVYARAIKSMSHLNHNGAVLMHKYGATSATDVTGFGLIGHAQNLATNQDESVDFIIDKLAVIEGIPEMAKILSHEKKLLSGKAVETSGGLLLTIPSENAGGFCDEYLELNGFSAHVVGKVLAGKRLAKIVDDPEIIEVDL
ncbi:hypothetical protein ACFFRR_007083 [Megaselia abdita]